ncbi:MAG: hypothetical protein COA88_09535 [Kordia sp.]|nr:MAG: hypothetical protein COA88_09535 [Kordia sp.]
MSDSKLPQLSKTQLAAIDLMITHMEESGKTVADSFLDGIVNAIGKAVDNILHQVVNTRLHNVDIDVCVEAMSLESKSGKKFLAFIDDLESDKDDDAQKGGLTLDQLIEIRNEYNS